MARRLPYRLYFMCLCGLYLILVFVFHGRLQLEIAKTQIAGQHISLIKEVPKTTGNASNLKHGGIRQLRHVKRNISDKIIETTKKVLLDKAGSCLLPTYTTQYKYIPVETKVFYVYSAYLDKRYEAPVVRVISLIIKGKHSKIDVLCKFRVGAKEYVMHAVVYEMCENHNRRYGGYILSCSLPEVVKKPCQVAIGYVDSERGESQDTLKREFVTINIMKLEPESAPFAFGVCIPPMFGDVKKESIVEFIELTKLLGSNHFIFYDFNITNNGTKVALDYYSKRETVTVIPWKLPRHIDERDIWYHGQLLAHNDCLYRSMSLMNIVAINDIDEYIVPHDKYDTWNSSLLPLMNNEVVGLSFNSAFYDPHAGKAHPSGLITMTNTGRSKVFSEIRTKVMLKPGKVFEVGIHHVSKPAKESFKIIKVKKEIAYLHHYRKCVSNYGMKCSEFEQDHMLENKYYNKLKQNYDFVMKKINYALTKI